MARQTEIARKLRRNSTVAERRLWRALADADLPVRFRRQHPIGPFIADFACPAIRLVIEIDGGQHAVDVVADQARTAELGRRGYRLIRFWNHEILSDTTAVLEVIRREVAAETPTSPRPSPP